MRHRSFKFLAVAHPAARRGPSCILRRSGRLARFRREMRLAIPLTTRTAKWAKYFADGMDER